MHPLTETRFPGAAEEGWKALKSYAGGPMQVPHRDFKVNAADQFDFWNYHQVPGSTLLALQNGTRFRGFAWNHIGADLSEETMIELNRGDVLVFRGEFIYSGAAYDRMNIRIRCYLVPPEYHHNPNTTEILAVLDPEAMRAPENQCPTCQERKRLRQTLSKADVIEAIRSVGTPLFR
ncbi:hypothetical protein PHYSODRAFT_338862 [Phytophthora sojae]|uniref:Uncharacterized protein n=1 Tax=Phytophthora sojae (strain P6497) TaxID=1094619 RepID=G5A3G9_PHYSP|nr:hypothetical protein PHYSODRAFT_338862 [Phytophthora sojae]EGZ10185.1 hypothetical protein PHYSODRAFT_338862 [Phytophthora sojae]|eukprot:XP_009535046.1 hypothetical protein PHYSODRAFT_338862 [Phytophthora sojae]